MATPTPDPLPPTPPRVAAGRVASAVSIAGRIGAGVLIFVDFFSDPAGVDPSTLAAAALLAAVAQGIEGSLAVIVERILSSFPTAPR